MALARDSQEEAALLVSLEAVAQMVVRAAQEARPRRSFLYPRVEHVVLPDLDRRGVQRLARSVVEHQDKAAQLVVLERLHHVRGVFNRDRRAFVADLQEVAAVGIAPDTLAEEQRDARIVDALLVGVPVAVAAKRDLSDSTA